MNIWVATQNKHKVEEISAILAPMTVKSFLDIENAPEVESDRIKIEEYLWLSKKDRNIATMESLKKNLKKLQTTQI